MNISDPHDRELLNRVHPADWKDPVPSGRYNLVVIGGGTAGLVTAAGAAGLGAKVALVEEKLLGGDCLNTGCVPSKALLRAARAAHAVKTGGEFGASARNMSFDFGKAMERMRRLRAGISVHDSAERFSRLGVDVFLGRARFTGADSVEVNGTRLRFSRAAICTGSRPDVPAIPGLAQAGFLTNETVFDLTALPKRFAVIGGGPVGCELAQAFARMGSSVVLLEHGDQLLPRSDPDAAAIVRKALERDGVEIRLRTTVAAVSVGKDGKILEIHADGRRTEAVVDEVLVAAGRLPNIEGMDLDKAGVTGDPRTGIAVNEQLRTANPRIYAAGDVCTSFRFTHAADAMARIVIANALFPGRQKATALVIPSCIYTDPEVAQVGLGSRDAGLQGARVVTLTVPLDDVDRAVLDGETAGFARVHLRQGTDRILGASVVASHAGEMISEITLAMVSGAGLSAVGKTIHPYPSVSQAWGRLADAFNRTRLTPFIQKLLINWIHWRRNS